MLKVVIFSGAGISAESGIQTFRDSNGLWENHDVRDVATPEAWERDPALVLKFYNERRQQILKVQPNEAHKQIRRLEKKFDVHIITQNIDDLHERAGSNQVIHLHGEIFKMCTHPDKKEIQNIQDDIHIGDLSPQGKQLRPYIVWFGESVPKMDEATLCIQDADVLIVVGTSLQVYPAAGLINYIREDCPLYVIDKNMPPLAKRKLLFPIEQSAGEGMKMVVDELIKKFPH